MPYQMTELQPRDFNKLPKSENWMHKKGGKSLLIYKQNYSDKNRYLLPIQIFFYFLADE